MNRKEQLREYVQASKSIYLDHTLSNKTQGDQLSSIEASMRELLRQPLTPPTLHELPGRKKETVQNFLMQHPAAAFMTLFMLLTLLVVMEIATASSFLAGNIDKAGA